MCPHLCSSGAGSASPGAQGCELGSAHGWMVLIHGAAVLNNTQKVLGWFHCNISRSAWYPEDTQLPVKGMVGMEKEQEKPPVRLWRLWERAVLDKQEWDPLSHPSPGHGSAESLVKGSFLV